MTDSLYAVRIAWNVEHHDNVAWHNSCQTTSMIHDLRHALNLMTTRYSARNVTLINIVWFVWSVDDRNHVTHHQSCDTASMMRQMLKNQWIFNIFKIFELFLKHWVISFSGLRFFPDLALAQHQDTYHSFGLTISHVNLTVGSQALAISVPRTPK